MNIESIRTNACRCLLLFIAPALLTQFALAQANPPNVVLLLSDDLGWRDIGCYGGPVETPTLDRLAERGMRFTDFYSGAAVCSPSRAVLLTGRTNVRCSIYSWINDFDQRMHLPKSEVTLAELLKANGYATAHFGKWHLGMPTRNFPNKPTPSDHGFDYWFATPNNAGPSHRNPNNFIRNGERTGQLEGYACDLVVDDACSWLDKRTNDEQPFFLSIWIHEPHAPLAAPPVLIEKYGEETDQAAVYSATIENTDRAIKRLIDKLHEIDAPEDTLIIYSSDNGSYRSDRVEPLRGSKGSNYEGGIRVPGIFYWPEHISAGTESNEPAGLIDIVPTICGLTKTELPAAHLDGADLSEFLTGTATKITREQPLFWCLPLSGPAVAVRDGRYGMVAFRESEVPRDREAIDAIKREIEATLKDKGIFASETRGSSFDRQIFEGFSDPEVEELRGQFIRLNQFHESWIPALKGSQFTRFELYDLESDPSQTNELSLRRPQVHARLKAQLLQISSAAFAEGFDWSSEAPAPGQVEASPTQVHRLESTFRSPFDAFVYVNRIPIEPEDDESHEDLTGRILGRLANQEGRVLVKLPPGIDRLAYQGFKVALEGSGKRQSQGCFACHQLPNLDAPSSTPPIPSLRNRSYSRQSLQQLIQDETHKSIVIDNNEASSLLAYLNSLSDVSDEKFRELIVGATVLDTSGGK